ncbi:VOC family protein [Lacrimispora sp. JR3]|uniref:VOC family protein n=1 Tax=Lacrimispora sinapis TaxID=3111456 RepID=UPI00374A106A
MNFCWVTLHVGNFEESLAFYHEVLKLPVSSRHSGGGVEMAMLGKEGQPKVELLCDGNAQSGQKQSGISVGISVNSLEETMEYLDKLGIPVLRGPISPNPSTRFIFIHDPDGYEVQLVEMK